MKINLLWATLAGAVAMMVMGFVFYVLLLGDVFENMGVSNTVMKENPDMIMVFLGNLAGAFLLAYIFNKWANISTFATGAQAGAIIGLLVSLYAGLIQYGTTNIANSISPYLLDSVVSAVLWAIAGGVIGLVLGKTGGNS